MGTGSHNIIYVAAKLKVADFLKDGPKDSRFLAAKTNTHEPSLYRVLRALTSIQVFKESEQGFELTDLSQFLISDSPKSLRVLAIMRGEEVNMETMGRTFVCGKNRQEPLSESFWDGLI